MSGNGISMAECQNGVTAPLGFEAGGLHCGIRKSRKDLALIVSTVPATVAGVFTLNRAAAAPIIVNKLQMKRSTTCSAVVVNAGVANACTGERGLNDAWEMVRATAASLGLPEEDVMISSTGVIGQYLPLEKILPGIETLSTMISPLGGNDCANAIMTTDTCSKEVAVRFTLGEEVVTIGGVAKGSGMICPNMATMLGFITTDARIEQPLLARLLSGANRRSFNRISVDGDMSTNDMVLLMANGLAMEEPIREGSEEEKIFSAALEYVLIKLAKMIARDGEGATKLVEVMVTGATDEAEAEQAARSVASSNLVKTAIHGADANWGRILAAVGTSGVELDPGTIAIWFNAVPVLGPGYEVLLDEVKGKEALEQENVIVTIDLGRGDASARFWTCDLTKEYVHINASYRS